MALLGTVMTTRAAGGDAIIFPRAEGSNLQGEAFVLPDDFEGELNFVLVAFQREQQADVDTWLEPARALESKYEGLKYYELPTIYRANRAVQWFINTGMRRGIEDPVARARTVTLYLDKHAFREALKLPHEGTIYALLVDAGGEVIWRADGRSSKAKMLDLEKTISKILKTAGGGSPEEL